MLGMIFLNPYILTALIGLPVLWVILRVLPPRPKTRIFAAVSLLFGLRDRNPRQSTTPLWLLILRLLAVTCLILALSGPRWAPSGTQSSPERLLIVVDGGWAHAPSQAALREKLGQFVAAPRFSQTQFAMLSLADPEPLVWKNAQGISDMIENWQAVPLDPVWDRADQILGETVIGFDTLWQTDGLGYDGQRQEIYDILSTQGRVDVFDQLTPLAMIKGFDQTGSNLSVALQMIKGDTPENTMLQIHGVDPAGQPVVFGQVPVTSDQLQKFELPRELQARITKFHLTGQNHVGATFVLADQLRRPQVGLIVQSLGNEKTDILDPMHYVENAIAPFGDVVRGSIDQLLLLNPDVLIAADAISADNQANILDWIDTGGHLIRFAGPTMVRDITAVRDDELLPVSLRQGGRNLGGAMSWDIPKPISRFPNESPFFGLNIPEELRVSTQVLAEPSPDLQDRVIASLGDKTPLVTQKNRTQGAITFFHVTATPQWSNLPLSGLFVEMLQRLVRPNLALGEQDLPDGLQWTLQQSLNGDGTVSQRDDLAGVATEKLRGSMILDDAPLGIYTAQEFSLSRNLTDVDRTFSAMDWPASWAVQTDIIGADTRDFAPMLWIVAFILLVVDIAASLHVSGRLVVAALAAVIVLEPVSRPVMAADYDPGGEITLAHVKTGIQRVDDLALAGLFGLGDTLFFRTSIEPAPPVTVDVERDELAFFPLIYWPIVAGQPVPSDQAYANLNTYLASGGVILFDTQDQGLSRSEFNPHLRKILAPLNIPPLEPVQDDHVLTRAFYLLSGFPGRFQRGDVWVEAAQETGRIQGVPFRPLNDGVTPVLIGSNDWAAAWAMDDTGEPLVKIGQGFAGERQREMALRFGVNLVMHVLTGNYKSDQVHVPALLNRLGQDK